MAGPGVRPGAFLLEVAETGQKVMKAFTKFITYRKLMDPRLENLYATLDITTTSLTDLGNRLNKHELDFQMQADVTRSVAEKCKSQLETLLTLWNEGVSEGGAWKSAGTVGGQAFTTEVDPWLLITMALGGRDDERIFWKELDESRDTLVELNHIVKYMILKTLEDKYGQKATKNEDYTDSDQRATLTPEQEEELKNLNTLLPHIVQRHENIEKAKKAEAEWKKAEAEADAKFEEERKKREEMRALNRVDSFASEATRIPHRRRDPSPVRVTINKSDYWNGSVDSFATSIEAPVADSEEIYEEWTLRWNEKVRTVNRSWGFLGINFNCYFEDRGFWGTDPEYRTTDEMKEQEKIAMADKTPVQHKEAMCKLLQALPKKGGIAIDQLVDQRAQYSSHDAAKREWTVVAVRPKQKYTYGSAKKWGKDPLTTDWLITLKGVTIDTKKRSRNWHRDDAWEQRNARDRSPYYDPYYRSRSPVRRRDFRREIIDVRPQRMREVERFREYPIIPRNRSPIEIRERVRERNDIYRRRTDTYMEDGFVTGRVVVGKTMTKKEAEEKMVGVWESMVQSAGEKKEEEKEEEVKVEEDD